MYVRDGAGLARAVEVLTGAPVLAIDTEFMRERTYYARLCLVQIASSDDVVLIDALPFGGRLPALAPLLSDPASVKVVHAGSQDIEILLRSTGATPTPVFDTQVAATVAGFPTQVGYGQLVSELLGVSIDKTDTFTDWAVRPLSETQISYAEADVRYLPEVYDLLRERLTAEGRLDWLAADFERLADAETYRVEPREQYRRVKRASTLDGRSLGVLREVAAWREVEAQRRDIPRRWLLSDESLVEIARRRPVDVDDLARIRGVSERAASRAGALLAAVRAGMEVPGDALPRMPKRRRPSADAAPIADVLSGVLRLRAREHGVASGLLATRDDLERFAAGEREGHPLSEGWRHSIVGAELEAILDGQSSVSVNSGRLQIVPTETERRPEDVG